MNKLVLIGNGFDLAHGLKTSYADFILWYLNKRRNAYYDQNQLISLIKSPHVDDIPSFVSLNDFFEWKSRLELEIHYSHDFIKRIVSEAINKNWVDIEMMYYSEVVDFVILKEKLNNKYDYLSEVKKLNDCFLNIKHQLTEYLTGIHWQRAALLPAISDKFLKLHHNANPNQGLNKIIFINFNYTSTIKNYLDGNKFQHILINIHGELDNQENPVIFGYGDETDPYYEHLERLNMNEYLRFIKSFGYFRTINYQHLFRLLDSDNFDVHIMGHSCGLSDRILLSSIFQHKHCKRIQIHFYERSETENDFFEKTQEISRHFKPENKELMRSLITVFSESEPLVRCNDRAGEI